MTEYLMDTPGEGTRIELKTNHALTLDQLRWCGIDAGQSVLDLGCAAGTTSRILAGLVGPTGSVVGVDASDDRIQQAVDMSDAANLSFKKGSAETIPLFESSVDVSWSRFLFEYLPDPGAALNEMVRVTRPGGTVAVSDLDGNCLWHSGMDPWLEAELRCALDMFGDRFHPEIGRELPGMFLGSGLEDVQLDIRPYHVIAGSISEVDLVHWRMKLEGVRAALVHYGWPERRAASMTRGFEHHLVRPDTFTYSTIVTVKGKVPSHTRSGM